MALKTLRPRLDPMPAKTVGGENHQPKARWGLGRGGRPWRRKRLAVFKRDKYVCQTCGEPCMAPECDHVVPLSQGGSDELNNLATICPPCHKAKTFKESRDAVKKMTEGVKDC